MLYNIKRNNYRNVNIINDNRLKARAYFIPFSNEAKARSATILNRRYVSDLVSCLNGEWDFIYYAKIDDVPRNFDTDKVKFDKIPVPSCWQFTGYEPPFYTNVNYPFAPQPPRVPVANSEGVYSEDINGISYKVGKKQYNSVGVYRKFFDVTSKTSNYIISFLGVASSVEVYCNGRYVGYGEGSHNTAEFDISSMIVEGNNELVVVVHKWCTGSYLEDQDMFRNNGIFRDVCLFSYGQSYLFDYDFFATKNNQGKYDAIISAEIVGYENMFLTATIRKEGKIIDTMSAEASEKTTIMFHNLEVEEWNAETHVLYELTLVLTNNGKVIECVIKGIGFKMVEISQRTLMLNSKLFKIKGVNHHDTHPEKGYCLSPEEIEKDIILCKNFNVNAIRTSHYPPDPLLIELADFYGIYIIDEADIETHGLVYKGEISNKLKWKDHLWDRVERMYLRDRNSPSIVLWSLGNESGGIRCQDYCYSKLKELTFIPIIYERACAYLRGAYDVGAVMYPSVYQLEKVGKGSDLSGINPRTYKNKPLLMVEYAHAMGVGAGNLKEYWDVIYDYDCLSGGCIWEMVDHAVKHNEDYKYEYTYGGDHGEYTHDGNFCVDGLFFPDRTPHTGAYQMKNVYRPIRAKIVSPGLIELKNMNSFRNSSYLKIMGSVLIEGEKSFVFELPSDIEPGQVRRYDLNYKTYEGDCQVHIDYLEGDRLVGKEELIVGESLTRVPSFPKSKVSGKYSSNILTVDFGIGSIRFDKDMASLIGYSAEGIELLAKRAARDNEGSGRMYHNIFRAPIDNDMNIKKRWYKVGYDKLKKSGIEFIEDFSKDEAKITFKYLLGVKKSILFSVTDTYTVFSGGIVKIESETIPLKKGLPDLPRVGKTIEMEKDFCEVIYYANGPYESYPDFKEHVRLGVYGKSADTFLEPYIRPQESGNRTDARYLTVKNSEGQGIMFIASEAPFNFGIKNIPDLELSKCKHREDLKDFGYNYVSIDGFMSGVGSNSCGPITMKQYRLKANKPYKFSFYMVPFTDVRKEIVEER